MVKDNPSELKTTTFRLHLDKKPHFYISYKDKHDLFKQFKRKLRENGLSPSDIYLVEYDVGEPIQMNNADALIDAAGASMQMFNRDEKQYTSLGQPVKVTHVPVSLGCYGTILEISTRLMGAPDTTVAAAIEVETSSWRTFVAAGLPICCNFPRINGFWATVHHISS
nr:unnamed protein product [Haemonchus contortus]